MTPDPLYGALLKEVAFPSYEALVITGSAQLKARRFAFPADTVLIFVDYFDASTYAELFLLIRKKLPKAIIFQLKRGSKTLVSKVFPNQLQIDQNRTADSVEELDLAMREISASITIDEFEDSVPTASQLSILQAVASGISNEEIASSRNTSLRAVEALLSRSMKAIGISDTASSRSNVLSVQRYLSSMGLETPHQS